MPGRGLLAVACLVFIALCCICVVRKLERERRLLRKLRGRGAVDAGSPVPLRELSEDERDCAQLLAIAGVLTIRQNGCYLRSAEMPVFRRKRVRLALSGGFAALVLAVVVAVLILHR
ncbi:MAG: hypothetical protein JWO04_2001 [Gammaproteobacteria bacterium]|nr:hypothetical protein [Gammaproteobacteria bacterium]